MASAAGHHVTLLEAADSTGGHTRAYGACPIAASTATRHLADRQMIKQGAQIGTGAPVDASNLDSVLDELTPDHVVAATGARVRRDGFQGQTARPLPGHETGNCVGWDQVALGEVTPAGEVLVIDDLQDVDAPSRRSPVTA